MNPFAFYLNLLERKSHSKLSITGEKSREEKIWGRRRWLVMEKLLPLAKDFHIKLLGFGLPQFITANMGDMKMTIGFSSWQSNDWVKGTAFNIMSGFIGDGCYDEVYKELKEYRNLNMEKLKEKLPENNGKDVVSGVGTLFKKGEGYFEPVTDTVRFRQLCNEPIPGKTLRNNRNRVRCSKTFGRRI